MKRTKRRRMSKRRGRRSGGNPHAQRTRPATSLGTVMTSAVRSLIGLIPGSSALKVIADFGYKMLMTAKTIEDGVMKAEGNVYGLSTCLYPSLAVCLRDSPILTRAGKELNTNFLDGKLRSFTVTVEPTNVMGKRSGNWALLFTPYRNTGDHDKYKEEMKSVVPGIPELMRHPGVVADRADRPLTLTFRPRVEDGVIGLYLPLASAFGMICVAYQEENRDSWNEFSAEEFSCRVRMSATAALRSATIASSTAKVSTVLDATGVSTKEAAVLSADGSSKVYSYTDYENTESCLVIYDPIEVIPMCR